MAYGELVTQLHADLSGLDRDLNEARAKLKRFYEDATRMAASVRVPGAGGGRGGGGGGGGLPAARLQVTGLTPETLPIFGETRPAEDAARRFLAMKARAHADNARIDEQAARRAISLVVTRNRMIESEEARNERYRKEIAQRRQQDEKAAISQQMGTLRAANTQRQALAREELSQIELTRKARADAEKEFAQTARQAVQQGGRSALQQARAMDRQRTEELQKAAQAASRLNQHFDEMKQKLSGVVDLAKGLAGALGLGAAAGLGAAVLSAFNLNRELQLQKLTLAADLELTTKIVDAHGKYVGQQRELNLNLAAASSMIKQIRKESEATTLTEQELRAVTSVALAPTLRAGASRETGVHLIAQLANLAKIAGAQGEAGITNEVRAVLGGSPMVRRTRLGQILGLDPKELREAQDAGKLIDLLTNKIRVADPIIKQANASFDHLWSTLISKAKDFLQLSFENVFEKITGRVLDLNKAFSDEAVARYARTFSDMLTRAYDTIEALGKSDGFKALTGFFKLLIEHGADIIKVFLAIKAIQGLQASKSILSDLGTLAKGAAGAGAAGGASALGTAGAAATGLDRAVPVLQAGIAGYAIGTVLNDALSGPFQRLGAATAGVRPTPDLIRAFVDRRSARQRELSALRGQVEPERQAFIRAQSPEEVESTRNILAGTRAKIARLEAEEREVQSHQKATAAEDLRRVARDEEDKSKKKIDAELKTQAFIHRLLGKGMDDKREQLRQEERADEATIRARLGETERAHEVIRQRHQQLVDKLKDLDKEEALEYKKKLAEMTGDQKAALAAEYQDRLKSIGDMDNSEQQKRRLRLAAEQEYRRKLGDLERDWRRQEESLGRQAFDLKAELHRSERDMLKEIQDLQRRTAKEAEQLAREEADAVRGLARAREDQRQTVTGVQLGAQQRDIRGQIEQRFREEVNFQRPGPIGIGQEQTIRDLASRIASGNPQEADQALAEARRLGFLTERNARGTGLGGAREGEADQARAAAQAALARGDFAAAGAALGRARALGGGRGRAGVVDLAVQANRLGFQREDQADAEAATRENRSVEDAKRSVDEAGRRIGDLQERETQARKDYEDGLKRIQDNYQRQVVDITAKFVNLGEEAKKLTRTMALSGENLGKVFGPILRQLAGITPGAARQTTQHALAPVYHITFGKESLSIKGLTLDEIKKALTELLQKEARVAAPIRR